MQAAAYAGPNRSGVGILKIARMGVGSGTVQRIKRELPANHPYQQRAKLKAALDTLMRRPA